MTMRRVRCGVRNCFIGDLISARETKRMTDNAIHSYFAAWSKRINGLVTSRRCPCWRIHSNKQIVKISSVSFRMVRSFASTLQLGLIINNHLKQHIRGIRLTLHASSKFHVHTWFARTRSPPFRQELSCRWRHSSRIGVTTTRSPRQFILIRGMLFDRRVGADAVRRPTFSNEPSSYWWKWPSAESI